MKGRCVDCVHAEGGVCWHPTNPAGEIGGSFNDDGSCEYFEKLKEVNNE